MNEKIIQEFEKLIHFLTEEYDKVKTKKEQIADYYRLKQLKNALYVIKKYPYEFTLDTFTKDFKLPGIGSGTIKRIKEIIIKGKLSEIKNYRYISAKKDKIIEELETIVGVGRSIALDLYNKGVKSVKDQKKKLKIMKLKYQKKYY